MSRAAYKPEPVLQEFEKVGKYRVRVLKGNNGQPLLDIREFVENNTDEPGGFEGFTRKGVRLDLSHAQALFEQLREAINCLQSHQPIG